MRSRLSEELAAPLRVMRDTARRIARVCVEAKMDISEEDYVQSFKTGLIDVVYAWAKVSSKHACTGPTDKHACTGPTDKHACTGPTDTYKEIILWWIPTCLYNLNCVMWLPDKNN